MDCKTEMQDLGSYTFSYVTADVSGRVASKTERLRISQPQ